MPNYELLQQELKFKAVKSSGPGGQHVNKTASKIVLNFDIQNSEALSKEEKDKLISILSSRITQNEELILESSESRSQHKNKDIVIDRFINLIKSALTPKKKRKKTKPTKASKYIRLLQKKMNSEKKSNRQKPNL